MADQGTVSQAQQTFKDVGAEWTKLVAGGVAQLETFFGEVAKVQNQATAQLLTGFAEAGRIAKDSLAYAERAGGEWRKAALDAAKRTADLVTPHV